MAHFGLYNDHDPLNKAGLFVGVLGGIRGGGPLDPRGNKGRFFVGCLVFQAMFVWIVKGHQGGRWVHPTRIFICLEQEIQGISRNL